MARTRGFTLIELMITLALAAIVLTFAVPGFQNIIQNTRAASQANELVAALNLARSEAVRRGANVTICPSANQANCSGATDWSGGWIVFVDGAANALALPVIVGDPIRVWGQLPGNASLDGPAHLRFQPMGDVAAGGLFEHRLPGCSGDQGRDIQVNIAGRTRVIRVAC